MVDLTSARPAAKKMDFVQVPITQRSFPCQFKSLIYFKKKFFKCLCFCDKWTYLLQKYSLVYYTALDWKCDFLTWKGLSWTNKWRERVYTATRVFMNVRRHRGEGQRLLRGKMMNVSTSKILLLLFYYYYSCISWAWSSPVSCIIFHSPLTNVYFLFKCKTIGSASTWSLTFGCDACCAPEPAGNTMKLLHAVKTTTIPSMQWAEPSERLKLIYPENTLWPWSVQQGPNPKVKPHTPTSSLTDESHCVRVTGAAAKLIYLLVIEKMRAAAKCQELVVLSCQKPRRMMLKIKSKVLAAFSD